jgi:hypothetical protein
MRDHTSSACDACCSMQASCIHRGRCSFGTAVVHCEAGTWMLIVISISTASGLLPRRLNETAPCSHPVLACLCRAPSSNRSLWQAAAIKRPYVGWHVLVLVVSAFSAECPRGQKSFRSGIRQHATLQRRSSGSTSNRPSVGPANFLKIRAVFTRSCSSGTPRRRSPRG